MPEPWANVKNTFVAGANQRSASLALRDRLFIEDAAVPAVLARLRQAGVQEALLLVTCDRIEVQGIAVDPPVAGRVALAVLAEHAAVGEDDLAGQTYCLAGEEAVRHAFLVAASLDSTIVGEPHVLAQIKAGLKAARAAGMSGAGLESLIQAALATGKRVRAETGIAERPVSAAAAAVERARSLHGDLAACAALVIGAGEMGELIGNALREAGLGYLSICHPRPRRADAAARALQAHVIAFDDLASALVDADIIVSSLGSRQYTVSFETMRGALRARRNRPILAVDVAVPADVDPACDRLEAAFRYTFNDLERVAEDGRHSRAAAAHRAREMVEEAVTAFVRDRAERLAVPLLGVLRHRFEEARKAALLDSGGDADKATRLLVNRLLHGPTLALRQLAAEEGAASDELERLQALLKRLFETAEDDCGSR